MQNQPLDQKTLYHNIYDGEIFEKSRCIWHENMLMDFFRSTLISLGYTSISESRKVWQRGSKKVVVCLADDFVTCTDDYSTPIPYLFDKDTVVITDNKVNVPTQYKVFQLPTSYFGIYNYEPGNLEWKPSRRFNFSVNRLDMKRVLLFLELWHRCMLNPDAATLDYINFNCWDWAGNNDTVEGLQENFSRYWEQLDQRYQKVYKRAFDSLVGQLPFRNHNLSHEESHVSAWINVVMETYSSESVIALSEKSFRAMCLPVPWILYCGKHAISYLHSMGFDVMRDVIEHRYDGIIENKTAAFGDKMVDFIFEGADFADKHKDAETSELKARCVQAADHNRQLLKTFAQQWPKDFAAWWPDVVKEIE